MLLSGLDRWGFGCGMFGLVFGVWVEVWFYGGGLSVDSKDFCKMSIFWYVYG